MDDIKRPKDAYLGMLYEQMLIDTLAWDCDEDEEDDEYVE